MNWLLLLVLLVWIVGAVVAVLGLCWWAAASAYPEDAGDDWMDITDVYSDDHHPAGCDCDGIGLEGFTEDEMAVLRAGWLPLTDGERAELNDAFRAVVEGADR